MAAGSGMIIKCLLLFLSFSFSLNLFFLYLSFGRPSDRLTWTRTAALEAEAVASLSCSGHGRAFLDGIGSSQGKPTCECYACYGGSDCSQLLPDCLLDADSGSLLLFETYWKQKAESSAVVVSGWHRMSYEMTGTSLMSVELERVIRQLHSTVGNANAKRKFILFGDGSSQLLNAAVHALSHNSSSPASVVAAVPYYALFKDQTLLFKSENYEWKGDASHWNNVSGSSGKFIEFVTSPNNPDGNLRRRPLLQGPSTKAIYDYAYYWPHFTAIPTMVDDDIMLFSMSKLTGHAGSRLGWALIKDEEVYHRMASYTETNTLGFSHESQLRALKLLKVVLQGGGRDMFQFGYTTLSDRWRKLSTSLSLSTRFSLQKISAQYCNYLQRIREPSPAYAWLKCEMDADCERVLRAAGIMGRPGKEFGASSRYIRLSLIKTQDDFDLLLQRINALVDQEGVKSIF
ncbi:tryptophan aminotransferase-related protein 4-like protein [Cinnamomum micranthum f. kanehirae]|uniref:Tryptophan aminotransferase-related protein 4-like protein n=1 Tax=Cinnamomum micranthum f. kanehirae TaxID=337451 RepID=A0A3S3MPW0_9MAGN|nr:tryptophan aminotransferase-related protein 4-like protein [Cinnamomum micranthum f. kanehirae]